MMKTIEKTTTTVLHVSEVMPEVRTEIAALSPVIKWADENPIVWKIVTGHRSKAFGIGSCVYIGWAQQNKGADAILERARQMYELIECGQPYYTPESIFVWRASFTLDHYQDKHFTGGFVQQHDAKYPRSCLTLDYTPETLQEVLDKFCAWIDRHYDTHHITLDNQTVRIFVD